MISECGQNKGLPSLSSPEYLEAKSSVKNKFLDNKIVAKTFFTSDISSLLSSVVSSAHLSKNFALCPSAEKAVKNRQCEHYSKEKFGDSNTSNLKPVDWVKNAVVKFPNISSKAIMDCEINITEERQTVDDVFDLLTQGCRDTCKQLKIEFISCISSSVVDGTLSRTKKILLGRLIRTCIDKDPEFILKAALYCRRELNIRTTANLLIASACFHEKSRAFVGKYFSACVRTPSDWIEVSEYYAAISGSPSLKGIPKVLRKCMVMKFCKYDQYQLAKHCKHKARATRATKSKMRKAKPDSGLTDDHVDTFTHRLTNSPPVHFTMKDLIRRLHISRPKYNVMCILGKTYPVDSTDFIRMGLEGDWDESRAGKRMRLPVPLTWETELSINGNNSESWTKLITSNKVPHMAMLRNLRNILKSGIQNNVHEIVLRELINPDIIVEGKQFPFRYFAAFDVVHELKNKCMLQKYIHAVQNARRRKLKIISDRLKKKHLWLNKYLQSTSFKRSLVCDIKLLDRYEKALSEALDLSVRYNLPPIRGSTLIICSNSKYVNVSKQLKSSRSKSYMSIMGFLLGTMCTSMCEASSNYIKVDDEYHVVPIEDIFGRNELNRNRNRYIINNILNKEETGTQKMKQNMNESNNSDMDILQRVKLMYEKRGNFKSTSIESVLEGFYAYRKQFDKIVVFGDCHRHIVDYVFNYRTHIGPIKAIWGNLSGEDEWPTSCHKSGWVEFKGCTDQILRYIADANEDKLVGRVEKIDELYGLITNTSYQLNIECEQDTNNRVLSKRDYIKSAWNCCQVFVSSTFRDMYGERDLLCGILIPALRRNVAIPLRVHLNEIDLRWGVPEAATCSSCALQICLEQAAASDIFVLLLGDRYGWVPNDDQIQNLPKPLLTEVSKFYKRGMSMTEMEYHIAKQAAMSKVPLRERRHGTITFQEAVRRRICVFIRDSKSVRGVPIELRSEFEEADIEKRDRLNSFKELIRNDGVIVFHDYPAQFNGLVTDQPVMGSLDEFGNKFLSVLKSLLLQLYEAPMTDSGSSLSTVVRKPSNTTEFLRVYVYSAACAIAPRHLLEVERAFDALTERGRQVHLVRRMALDSTKSNKQISSKQSMDSSSRSQLLGYDGSVLLITGSAGSGKTTYLSALAISLTEADWYPPSTSSKQSFNIYNPKEQLMSPGKPSGERRKFVSQRPKLAKHHILMHFSGGLAVSGLPPKRHLSVMLKKWTKLLISQLEDICSSDGAAMKLLNEIKLSLGMSTSQANTTTAFCDVELRSLIQCFTQIIKFIGYLTKLRFAFLIDDCHELQPTTLEWLPVVLPKNVRFVLTCDSRSAAAQSLASRADCLLLAVSGLTTNERCAAVRSLLGRYGKVLSESGFQNQLSILVRKRDADVPLYLRLACEELRLYGTYEQLDEKLKQLPDTISSFVEHAIRRVELDCGSDLTRVVLGFLICSRCPLSTDELHGLVDEWLCESAIKDEFEEGNCNADPWKELTITSDDISLCLDKMYLNESVIQKVITGQWSNDMHRSKSFRKQPHLPSLALHILLTGLHPLLSGFSDEGDFIEMNSDDDDEDLCEKSIETIKRQKLTIWNLGSKAISFRSCELRDLVNDICFNRLNYASTHQKFASYYNKPKRSNDEIHLKTVTLKTIHNILAKQGSNMKDVIYHLYHAERLDIVACLLSSPTFLIHQIQSGYGSTLLEDFRRCVTTDRNDQLLTRKEDHPSINDMNDKIIAMQTFIASNYELLTKHPSSFAELAINQDVSEWIQKVGLVYLFYSDPPDVDPSQRQMFFSIKRDRDIPFSLPKVVQPFLIHKPVTPLNGSRDVPISVAIDRMGTLLAYGTESGTVNVVQIQSMKVLCSFLGHNLPILSLCFIDGACIEYGIPSSQLWLVSTCEDGGIIVWDISNVNQEVTYKKVVGVSCQLFSLSGHHRRSVTNSAWHPERRLLATGSLDCLLCLWDLGDLGFGSISTSRALGFGQVKPSKRFEVNSPINALAFRFPRYKSNDENSIAEHLRDVIAIGCWDGFVHFYSLISMSKIKSIAVSCFSICSLAYSPNGGNTLAILDTGGQTYLLDADTFVYLGSLTEHTNFSPVWNSCSPEKKLHLLPNQRGSVCFSKPNGRYLIQTGSGSSGGRINVWNACPGAPAAPWVNLSRFEKGGRSSAFVTTCAIEADGHRIIVGYSDGLFSIASIDSGDTLFNSDCLVPAINDNSSVEAIACTHTPYRNCASLMIVGWSSGAVRLYYWEPEPNTDAGRDDIIVQTKPCITHINTFWSHSIEHTENGVGEAGGTLCVAGSFCIAVSGGGNCESWFYIVNTDSDIPKVESICFRHHSAQVSAIAISDSYVATGSKDKNIVIYEYSIQTRSVTLKYILRRAADDWITSLVWSLYPADSRPANASLFVGSNDELIRRYSISENDYKLQQVLVSHKAGIKSLTFGYPYLFSGSTDGHVVVWQSDEKGAFQPFSQMNISVGSNTNETVIAPPNLVKIESFIPKHCNSECRKTLAFDFDNRSDCSPMIDGIYEAHPTSEMEVDDLSSYPLHRDDTVDCDLNDNNKVQELRIFDRSKSLPPHDNKNVRLLIGQTISLSAGSHRFQGFRFRVYKPSVLGYHATLSGHAGLAPCVITCASSPNSHEDALLVSVAGQGGDANTIGCDIRLWNLPLPDTSSLHYPIQHTGSVTCADHLKVTKNVNICISGSTGGDCIFWAICCSNGSNIKQKISRLQFLRMNSTSWKPLRRLTSSYERPNYPINSIVTQIWRNYDDTNEYSIHYFIYIACGYELWILHIELNNENDIENTFMELFTEKGRLHVILSELAEAWATKKIAGCAKIKKYQLNRVVVQMSAIHQEPTTISQCGVVILLSNGEVIMLPYMSKDDKFVRIRIQNDLFPSSHWCTSIHSFTNGILVAHEGSVLFHLYGDPKCVLQPLRGCMNNLENLYVDTIEPLCLPFRNSLLSFKIVTSKMKSEPRIVILNNDDEMIVNIMLADLNISVTAYCLTSAHVDSQTSLTVYLLLATSDSVLRLLKCSSNDYNQTGLGEWEQIRTYPTGERINKLLTLDRNPLTIMCGHETGEISFYTIL